MKAGRLVAIFAALVMLSWPFAMPLAAATPHDAGAMSSTMAQDHCPGENPGEAALGGECSYQFLCAQLCAGVMPANAPKALTTHRLSHGLPAPAQSPDALAHIPPEPPPRLL